MSCISFSLPFRGRCRGVSRSLPISLLLLAASTSEERLAAQSPEVALPGRVIDIRAGEFFFQSPDTIPAGVTTFRLTQMGMLADRVKAGLHGRALVADSGDNTRGAHMLWIVRLEQGHTVGELYAAAHAGETVPWATQLGGASVALPPRSTNATLDLAPGNYALVCYIGSARADRKRAHFLRGMFRPMTVVADTSAKRHPLPKPHVRARIVGDRVVVFSAPLARGRQVIEVVNETERAAEFKFQRMHPAVTARAFLAQRMDDEPGIPWGGLSDVPPGRTLFTTIDFASGEYVVGTRPAIRHPTSSIVVIDARSPR